MDIIIMPVGVLGTNCYIVGSNAKGCAIIDPGAQPEKIVEEIAKAELTPRCILLTHGHHDHIGGVKKLTTTYPDIKVYIGEDDLEMLGDGDKSLAMFRNATPDEFIIKDAESLKDGQEIEVDELKFRVLATPGHTKGGVCFTCRDVLFSGDTLFRGDVGRTDLYGGDYDVLLKSLKKIYELEGDYVVYPGHGDYSSLEFERKSNRYMAEAL